MRRVERILLSIEDPPFGALYRLAIGFVALPVLQRLCGTQYCGEALAPFLLAILLMLRLGPAFARRLVRFSPAVQAAWMRRRQLAKRYDSYQWRKLFWIGAGLMAYCAFSGELLGPALSWGLFCMISGGLGMVLWGKHTRTDGFLQFSQAR